MSDRETFSECVVGYRRFRLVDWLLTPLSAGGAWKPGINHARCRHLNPFYGQRPPGQHKAPAADCHCGLYGLHEVPEPGPVGRDLAGRMSTAVIAAIAAWGDLEVHRTGFRAEYAQILAISHDEHVGSDDLADASEVYGVPIVPRDALQAEALRHGRPLPASALPSERESDVMIRYVLLPRGKGSVAGIGMGLLGHQVVTTPSILGPTMRDVLKSFESLRGALENSSLSFTEAKGLGGKAWDGVPFAEPPKKVPDLSDIPSRRNGYMQYTKPRAPRAIQPRGAR